MMFDQHGGVPRVWRALRIPHPEVYAFAVLWAVGALVPVLLVVGLSVMRVRGVHIAWTLSLQSYRDILETGRWQVVLRTMKVASVVTAICFAAGFPFAFWLAKRARSQRLVVFVQICLTVPFFLDPSARVIVWRAILGSTGLINTALLHAHIIAAPIEWLLFSDFSVYLGLVASYFPNMVLPLYLSIMLIDDELLKASADLGASPGATLRNVVAPLAMPGMLAGAIFTFIPILGDNVVPTLLGGGKKEYIADSVLNLSTSMNYTVAAAFAAIVLALLFALLALLWLVRRRISLTLAGRVNA